MDVSIIIPSYNCHWSLPRAVNSCRGTRCRTEIIVIDDGSSDESWAWLQTQSDLVVRRQPNQGKPWAVNHGLSLARGSYLRFLDCDDWLEPGIIDKHFEQAEATGADLVYSRVDIYDETSKSTHRFADTPLWDDFMAEHLGEGPGLHVMGMQFRRTLFENVRSRPEFAFREDRSLVLEIGLLDPRIATVPGCAGYWVRHGHQLHAGLQGVRAIVSSWQLLTIFQRTIDALQKSGKLTERRRKAAAISLWPVAHWIGYGFPDDAAAVADWVYRLDPKFIPPQKGLIGRLYRVFGFRSTQRLLRLRRHLLSCCKRKNASGLGRLPS
jgi:glycosyltransferase involved in cell wall biosynthesis